MHPEPRSPTTAVATPLERVTSLLLSTVQGDILFIRTPHATTVCQRATRNTRSKVLSWLHLAGRAPTAIFIAGKVSKRGGWFQVIDSNQAQGLLTIWIIQELQRGVSTTQINQT